MRILNCLLICFCFNIGLSQLNIADFVRLKSEGNIPEDFTKLSAEKVVIDLSENVDMNLDEEFFLDTRYFIDELLLSGQVIFNDPVSNYIGKVADYLLEDQPELRSKLRFYTLKSNAPNAFSTDQGIILFSTGLFAQLDNEAQLAYVLSHEIIHYTEKHLRNEYIEMQQIIKGQGKYNRMSVSQRIKKLSQYSQNQELEADSKAIDIYLKSAYDVTEILKLFDVLHFCDLPFADIQIDSSLYNTENFILPAELFPDSIHPIIENEKEDYEDNRSTHPNIYKRINNAIETLDDRKSTGNKKFVVSETDFYYARNLSRFENINLLLSDRLYGRVLYDTYILKREFGNNKFLDFAQFKAIYGLMKYKNYNRYGEVIENLGTIQGESYALHYFLYKITKLQLNIFAMRYGYDLSLKYPNDTIIANYFQDCKFELAVNSGITTQNLITYADVNNNQNSADTVQLFDIEDSLQKIENSNLSSFEKLRRKKELEGLNVENQQGVQHNQYNILYALSDLVKDKNLISELNEIIESQKNIEESIDTSSQKQQLLSFKKQKHLGIKKVIVVDPIYLNYKLNEDRNHLKSEELKMQISDYFTRSYPKIDIETDIVDSKNILVSDLQEFNDLSLLNQWVTEIVDHDGIPMYSSVNDQMQDLNKRYETTHYLFSGIYGYKLRNELNRLHVYGLVFIYTIPIVLIDLLAVQNYFDMHALSIDARKDEIEFEMHKSVNLKGTDRVIKGYVYEILYQLNSK